MSHTNAPGDDQRPLAEALHRMGAVVALSKSGRLLRIDFRPAASNADDAAIQALACSTKLKELYLDGAPITPACVADLLKLENLSVLDIQNTALDDAAIERLASLTQLSILLVRGSRITVECLRSLRRRLTRVRIVA